jgi:hypothetical protein
MGYRIPAIDHPAREAMGDIAHVVEVLAPANVDKLQPFSEVLRAFRNNFPAGAKAVVGICLREDNDERWLISIGPRGGWKKLWNFGNGRV